LVFRIFIIALATLALASCGTTPGCRAISTGALGAAGGAAIGALTGGAAAGALIGGVGGAVVGGATSPRAAYAGPSPFCW